MLQTRSVLNERDWICDIFQPSLQISIALRLHEVDENSKNLKSICFELLKVNVNLKSF